ncbi:hypothetical protein SAMN05428967_0341 [Phyllobacterium sp. YR620]|uniref:hypothetical protein n=1 Tax=unclassified Phyllobacterium TaxID=2638441 RepID=UPI0004814B9B|nr:MULTISPECIES: hypothetical protein [unclassified Phyllobacterium]MRG56747.1 antifreeze protein [Phyllobacterium sp. SYP-B3895]SDO86009.1 hypothetical protein SAMN05428967_0341 [Phyllobacterium sp. YR620]
MAVSFKTLAVTATIALGSIIGVNAASAAPIAAAPMTDGASPLVKVDYYRRDYYRPPYRPAPACTPGQAASKASRMGLYNTRVVVNRNVVRVAGWKRGYRTAVVFARAPGCPVVR